MNIQSTNGMIAGSIDQPSLKSKPIQGDEGSGVKSPASQATQVTISDKARALLDLENGADGNVQPLTAGGTTLPPWPPSKQP